MDEFLIDEVTWTNSVRNEFKFVKPNKLIQTGRILLSEVQMDELQVDEIAVGEKVNLINLGEFRAHFLSPMYRLKLTDESCTFSR